MSFSEIYLCGCDSTNVISELEVRTGGRNYAGHAYENDDIELVMKQIANERSIASMFWDQYILFKGYERLADYCGSSELKLINCRGKSLIDSIPYMNIEDVL